MPLNTADDWRIYLDRMLAERLPQIALYSAYYDGDHRLQFATSKFREAFGELFGAFATNWCGLVVDVAVERLGIQGFRMGEDDADEDAWAIWQANHLDGKSIAVHTEAVKCGTAYLSVGPPRRPGEQPVITVEHPNQVIVAHDPSDRTIRLAALKKYRDAEGNVISVVYLPDSITTFVRHTRMDRLVQGFGLILPGYDEGNAWDEKYTVPNLVGVVPIIPLENSPNILTGGTSDLKPAIALNDAANKFFTDMIHASEYTSFPQRVLTGVEIPRDPITGEVAPEAEIRASVSRLWAFEAPDAAVHDLAAASLSNYVEGIDLAVQHLAAQTRTPPHYLLAKLANISGDALKAAETGLTARARRMHVDFSDPWEETMRLSFAFRALDRRALGQHDEADRDEVRSKVMDSEVIWVDPESRHPAQISDSLVKRQQIGVPRLTLWAEAGYTPQQIKRMIGYRAAELTEDANRAEAAAAAQAKAAQGDTPPSAPDPSKQVAITTTPRGLEVSGLPGPQPVKPSRNGAQPSKPEPKQFAPVA